MGLINMEPLEMTNKIVVYISVFSLVSMVIYFIGGCSNDFMGANKVIYSSGGYVERWYLNPDYSEFDIPYGTGFYGDSAEKERHKFVVKYYVRNNLKSGDLIPEQDMWKINHNGKISSKQDDDRYFYYWKNEYGTYEKFKVKSSGSYLAIPITKLLPIRSCDGDWCSVYVMPKSVDFYVKREILVGPIVGW